jgi:signal-transduction protein with cAMP-binding, CBS, and nucleotidyltransferase domain
MSLGPKTIIVEIPQRVIDECVKKLANTGENKEKSDFMRHFDWFDNFTQSLKTKFNNIMTKKVFYPGMKIIEEGKSNPKAYIIVNGNVKLMCNQTGNKFTYLEY